MVDLVQFIQKSTTKSAKKYPLHQLLHQIGHNLQWNETDFADVPSHTSMQTPSSFHHNVRHDVYSHLPM